MRQKAFTLIELLVVIAIIVLLVSILVPSLKKARELAERLTCLTTLRNHGINIEMYATENKNIYPCNPDSNGSPGTSPQFRYFWQAMDDFYPGDAFQLKRDLDDPFMNYVCPVFRNRWAAGDFNSFLAAGQWWFEPDLYGYSCNFGNFNDPRNASRNAAWRYRAFGGLDKSLVGSQLGESASQVGAIPAGAPSRLVMMSDFGFCDSSRLTPLREPGEWAHPGGWGVLLGDGHAAFFEEANDDRDWYNAALLRPELAE